MQGRQHVFCLTEGFQARLSNRPFVPLGNEHELGTAVLVVQHA